MLDCLNCLRLKECYILGAMEQFELSNGIEAIVISCKSFLEEKNEIQYMAEQARRAKDAGL